MSSALTVGAVLAVLDELYPPSLAQPWDVVGLAVGSRAQPVQRIGFAVDCTVAVVAEAAAAQAQLLICHHPPFLRGIQAVDLDEPKGRLVADALAAGVSVVVAHTNADLPRFSTVEALADVVGLGADRRPLVARDAPDGSRDPDGSPIGLGRVADLPEPTTLGGIVERLRAGLPATARGLKVAGELDRRIDRAAVQAGSGDDLLGEARRSGADVYVTSDLRHHPASDALAWTDAPALIDIPHWAAEWLWLPVVRERLEQALGDLRLTCYVSTSCTDPWTGLA